MRATARKRPPFMTFKRWVFVVVASILLIVTGFFIYFRDIQQPQWSAKEEARKQAVEAAELVKVDEIYEHIWNKKSWIVKGSNEGKEELFVWIADDQSPTVVKATYGVAKEKINTVFKANKPDGAVIRIQPGLLDDKQVWEVYYSAGTKPKHYYYDFYSFTDGALVNSYALPAKTEP